MRSSVLWLDGTLSNYFPRLGRCRGKKKSIDELTFLWKLFFNSNPEEMSTRFEQFVFLFKASKILSTRDFRKAEGSIYIIDFHAFFPGVLKTTLTRLKRTYAVGLMNVYRTGLIYIQKLFSGFAFRALLASSHGKVSFTRHGKLIRLRESIVRTGVPTSLVYIYIYIYCDDDGKRSF